MANWLILNDSSLYLVLLVNLIDVVNEVFASLLWINWFDPKK